MIKHSYRKSNIENNIELDLKLKLTYILHKKMNFFLNYSNRICHLSLINTRLQNGYTVICKTYQEPMYLGFGWGSFINVVYMITKCIRLLFVINFANYSQIIIILAHLYSPFFNIFQQF